MGQARHQGTVTTSGRWERWTRKNCPGMVHKYPRSGAHNSGEVGHLPHREQQHYWHEPSTTPRSHALVPVKAVTRSTTSKRQPRVIPLDWCCCHFIYIIIMLIDGKPHPPPPNNPLLLPSCRQAALHTVHQLLQLCASSGQPLAVCLQSCNALRIPTGLSCRHTAHPHKHHTRVTQRCSECGRE